MGLVPKKKRQPRGRSSPPARPHAEQPGPPPLFACDAAASRILVRHCGCEDRLLLRAYVPCRFSDVQRRRCSSGSTCALEPIVPPLDSPAVPCTGAGRTRHEGTSTSVQCQTIPISHRNLKFLSVDRPAARPCAPTRKGKVGRRDAGPLLCISGGSILPINQM